MGQKVHPIGFRLGVNRTWDAHWYAGKEYTTLLHEDILIRNTITSLLPLAGIPRIEIDRSANQVTVTVHTAKPGIVIGKSGAKVEELRKKLETTTGKRVRVNIQEIRAPELDAVLVSRSIAEQLRRRIAYRRAMKQAIMRTLQRGAKGIKIVVSGRLGGAEIARTEREVSGSVPLHTLRADIDYGHTASLTTYGMIGIKVWIYKGDILPVKKRAPIEPEAVAAGAGTPE